MRADAVALMRWASRATGNHREPRVTGLVLREALKPTDEGSASTEGGGGGKEEGGERRHEVALKARWALKPALARALAGTMRRRPPPLLLLVGQPGAYDTAVFCTRPYLHKASFT